MMFSDELKELMSASPRSLAIVVGAGVTIGALPERELKAMATWTGLLREGLRRCELQHRLTLEETTHLRALLSGDDPGAWIEVADAVTTGLGGAEAGEFRRWLRETAGTFAEHSTSTTALEALADLAQRGAVIATVNYDGLLEEATGLAHVTWRDQARVERVIRGDEQAILHLHGHWSDPASIVLGGRSYQAIRDASHAQAVMSTLRMTRTLVFIGHGAGLVDQNWGPFLRGTEDLFAGSEYRHYRLVRESERERVQEEHPDAQRIVALTYGDNYDDLGPFLRSLVPDRDELRQKAEANAEPERHTVVLRINIGDKQYDWLSEPTLRAKVDELFGDPDPLVLPEVHLHVDRNAIHPREWRTIAHKLLQLRDAAKAAAPAGAKTRFVVAGQAPLPVFAYFGQLMQHIGGPIAFINLRRGTHIWDVIDSETLSRGDRDLFTVDKPGLARDRSGRLALVVRCSIDYPYLEDRLAERVAAEGANLLCSYKITSRESHKSMPMIATDLAVLLDHIRDALAWMAEEDVETDALVVAIGGPTWAAFWIGLELNPYTLGYRVDFPNFVGRRYVPALSSPMHTAPWLDYPAKILFAGAEPVNGTRTRGANAFDSIQEALEREHGRDNSILKFRFRGAIRLDMFQREVELFNPDILHLHLHGTKDGNGLAFEKEGGDGKRVGADDFVDMLRSTKVRPALVVLSACNSAAMSPAMVARESLIASEIAECVVYMDGEVPYAVAIAFASAFYGALARGNTLLTALDQGKSRVRPEWGEKRAQMIKYLLAPGLTAEEIQLLPKPKKPH